jgi:dTDP-4-amino-4,6-dideoxygalactose transaminase
MATIIRSDVRKIEMASPNVGIAEVIAVSKVIFSKKLAQGSTVGRFESSFSSTFTEDFHAVAVNSGTSALHLGFMAMGLDPDDEVIVPAFTFAATANAVKLAGAKVVFADVDIETMTISPDTVRPVLTPKTKAIVFVSLFGNMSYILALKSLCESLGIVLIEDAAQSMGSMASGFRSGTIGDWSAFSFYPTKNITTGEGGMFVSKDPEILTKVKMLRNQGMLVRYQNELAGLNNRMTEIAAAIGLVQIRKWPKMREKRIHIANSYDKLFAGTPVRPQAIHAEVTSTFHQYTVRVDNRDEISQELDRVGVPTAIYYPTPINNLKPYRESFAETPNSEALTRTVLSLPIHPNLKESQIGKIGNAILSFLS